MKCKILIKEMGLVVDKPVQHASFSWHSSPQIRLPLDTARGTGTGSLKWKNKEIQYGRDIATLDLAAGLDLAT